ncbi:hypothetical protein SpCBS45565_g02246 [Spizellomyces sp. 'palustris']|nr:hypothetical protein SpCBS45565_g02246 [Spizellomyces sp. 'palustris']
MLGGRPQGTYAYIAGCTVVPKARRHSQRGITLLHSMYFCVCK